MSPLQRKLLRIFGMAAIAAGAIWLGSYVFFMARSHVVGNRLVHREQLAVEHIAPASASASPSDSSLTPTSSVDAKLSGLLEIPALHLTAPVVEGVGNSSIDVAVGHLPTSVDPGQNGTSILAAHNATWFRHIDQLKPNDLIRYVTPKGSYTFSVTGHRVVHTGTPIYNSSDATLILESCDPLNALYLTPFRFLVDARLVGSSSKGAPVQGGIANQVYRFTLPQGLAPKDDTLATNYVPMGVLSESGSPDSLWLQSNNPLNASTQATDLYIAVIRTALGRHQSWWQTLAPNVPISAIGPLWGAKISRYDHNLDVNLEVSGTTVSAIKAKTMVTIAGGKAPGTYAITAGITVQKGVLTLTDWTMTPFQH